MIYQDCGASEFNQTDSNWSHAFNCRVSFNFWSSYLWHLDSHDRSDDLCVWTMWLCQIMWLFRAVSMWLESSLVPQEILHSDHWGLISWCHHLWAPRLSDFPKDSSFTSSKKKDETCQPLLANIFVQPICWQFQPIPLPKPFHTSPKPHRPKTQSDFGSKAKQFSHAGGLTIISTCEAMIVP